MKKTNAGESRVTVHMVSSLDGFIAREDGSISWMQSKDLYPKGMTLSETDIQEYLTSIDCYVMGSKTYEQALILGWPYGDKTVVVLTHRNLKSDRHRVKFYSGDPEVLFKDHLQPNYKNIWLVGGSETAKDWIQSNLADEIIISIMPVILGAGTLFFDYIRVELSLHLKDVKAYKDGMVELCYEIVKE